MQSWEMIPCPVFVMGCLRAVGGCSAKILSFSFFPRVGVPLAGRGQWISGAELGVCWSLQGDVGPALLW